MTHKIFPNEVYVTEFGALIRTRCPASQITDAMIHQRVVAANLSAGDIVRIQCITHDRAAVTHYAEWLVFDRRSEIKRIDVDDRVTRQVEDVSFSVFRTQEWRATPAAKDHADDQNEVEIKWNLGNKTHDVVRNGEVLASFDKDNGGKEAAKAFVRDAA